MEVNNKGMRQAQQAETIHKNEIITSSEMKQSSSRSASSSTVPQFSSDYCSTSVADDEFLRKFSAVSLNNSQKPNIKRNWELRCLGKREGTREAIGQLCNKDSGSASSATDNPSKLKTNVRNKSVVAENGAVINCIRKFSNESGMNANTSHDESNEKQSNLRVVSRSARETIKMFNDIGNETKEKLEKNPFSPTYTVPKYNINAQDYGRPVHGSKTEARGIKAGDYVMREVIFLCEIIDKHAKGEPPNRTIRFGPLFHIYAHYSDKLVGMLIRARKYKLVDFEGEMLYQRQDDDKIISLLKPIEEIRKLQPSGDPVHCISLVANN